MKALDFKRIGARIKEMRIRRGLTQEFVADRLDLNASHISNIERGRAHPSLTALVRIADIFECPVEFFIKDEYCSTRTPDTITSSIDDTIMDRIKYFNPKDKERILKIIELL